MTALVVRHATRYEYGSRVELASHMLHLRPRALAWQRVLRFEMREEPAPDLVRWGTDHFGNDVAWVFLDRAHSSFEVVTQAVVEVGLRAVPRVEETPAWERVVAQAQSPRAARTVAEFTFGSPMAPAGVEARAYAAESFPPGRAVLAGLLDLMGRIGRDFRFDPEVTTVSTPVERVLQLRAGVCQDFAHLMIGGLRGLGLPARYVSGYLRTVAPAGQARMRGADHSHAWVGCWLGPEHGWVDLDPTNDVVVADGHVWLGWGRDYACVSPIRGMLLGGDRHTLAVSVDIAPEEKAGEQVGEQAGEQEAGEVVRRVG